MSLLTTNLDGGQTDAALSLAHFAALFPNSGVLSSAALTVAAQGSPDMSVKVSGSLLADVALIKTTAGGGYFVQNTDDEDVTILANASGVTKTDAIVLYVDLTDGDPANAGSPGAAHLIAVRRAGVSTGAPTDGEIDSAASNNPWVKLAEVSVINGAASITGGNITDIRLAAWFSTFFYGSNNIPGSAIADLGIAAAQLAAQAVTESKLSTSAIKLGYTPKTTAQNSLGAGPTDLTSLSVTVTAPTARGIKLTAFIPVTCNATGQQLLFEIKEGSTVLQTSAVQNSIANVQNGVTAIAFIAAPSAGSHTYKLTTETAGGTWNMNASATQPAFILAEAV